MRWAFLLLGVISFFTILGLYLAFGGSKTETPPISNQTDSTSTMSLTISSPAFVHEGQIPSKYTCDGENISPEIHISGVPEGTQSLVLVMDDPDIPDSVKQARGIEKFDHWTLYGIPPETTVLPEGALVGNLGLTSRGEAKYGGPCPPDREHRYFFRLYALTGTLNFFTVPTQRDVEGAAKGMMIEGATLMGRYNRPTNAQ
jgi:Raf kinase inhibitor-like YbhB/YbcL family protein